MPAVVGLEQFAPVWLTVAAAVAAGIVIGSAAAAAGWLDVVRRRGQRERRGQHLTAGRRPPGAEPEPVGGAAAAELVGERQARGISRRKKRAMAVTEMRKAMACEMKV